MHAYSHTCQGRRWGLRPYARAGAYAPAGVVHASVASVLLLLCGILRIEVKLDRDQENHCILYMPAMAAMVKVYVAFHAVLKFFSNQQKINATQQGR